tara:strand:+ start:348 stop:1655 length:1308 start_codon:yes stop_codon:yes gene_type:complete
MQQIIHQLRKIIYQLRKIISLYFIKLALKIESHKLCALVLLLNFRKYKNIKHSSRSPKKILVFNKSGGNEDLITSFSEKNNDIIFYWIPRSLIRVIFGYFLKSRQDYFTKLNDLNEINKKKLSINFLTITFRYLGKFKNIDAFISFNVFYYPEKFFEEVSKNLDKKYIVLHKESALTPIEEERHPSKFQKYNDKSIANNISVYSDKMKKIFIQSKIAKSNQIIINGCPRSDYAFKLRKFVPKNDCIIFYLIETNRYKNNKMQKLLGIKSFTLKKINKQVSKFLVKYAENNPNIKIIFKGKTGIHKRDDLIKKSLPTNCYFIDGGTGDRYLRNAKVVIAFNSTIVFETIASNRNLIIPNFNLRNKVNKKLMHKIDNENYYAYSLKDLAKKLSIYMNSRYINKKISKLDEKTLKYYLGNTDGKSGERMRKFIIKAIN